MVFYGKTFTFGRTRIAAIAFAALLLLPAIGIAGKPADDAALQTASAQFITPDGQATNATSVQNASSFTLRGFIGSMVSTIEDVNATGISGQAANQSDYIVAGRWRMVVNETLVQRFVANLTMAKTDGSEYHSIFLESIGRHSEFENNTSRVTTQVYIDGVLLNIAVPITLEVNDRVLKITDIGIGVRTIGGDDKPQDALRIIDRQSIYGIVQVQET
jgi:hypothetical protein